ncbi:hypothetical protein K469DRAFT_689603 [Zopfia rhizophila CBS 207.26]|uniref:Uncharacterized protein n=1 Tax=Zopfia rhizophila CBS 207.26 TaxID=1314779 RepID=A0A6A6DW84_9PEZI|nr:hypothetical protein K469DRAFT_689603 [Zopfia rhizophila CBS 207.26]
MPCDYLDCWTCPECGAGNSGLTPNFCPLCGHKDYLIDIPSSPISPPNDNQVEVQEVQLAHASGPPSPSWLSNGLYDQLTNDNRKEISNYTRKDDSPSAVPEGAVGRGDSQKDSFFEFDSSPEPDLESRNKVSPSGSDGSNNDTLSDTATDYDCSSYESSSQQASTDLGMQSYINFTTRHLVERIMNGLRFFFDLKSGIITCTTSGSTKRERASPGKNAAFTQSSNSNGKRKLEARRSRSPGDGEGEDSEMRPLFGVDCDKFEKLKSRRGTQRLSECERWRNIYRILFPDVEKSQIPSPYISPDDENFWDHDEEDYDTVSLQTFIEYSRRELPHRFESRIEVEVSKIVKDAIERKVPDFMSRMKETMKDTLQNAYDEVVSSFVQASDTDAPDPERSDISQQEQPPDLLEDGPPEQSPSNSDSSRSIEMQIYDSILNMDIDLESIFKDPGSSECQEHGEAALNGNIPGTESFPSRGTSESDFADFQAYWELFAMDGLTGETPLAPPSDEANLDFKLDGCQVEDPTGTNMEDIGWDVQSESCGTNWAAE